MPFVCVAAMLITLAAGLPAEAHPGAPGTAWPACSADRALPRGWNVSFSGPPARVAGLQLDLADDQATAPRRPVPVEYSDAYKVRARIHKIASFATLPLFAAQYYVGQDLYDNPSESKRGLHGGLAAGTAVLFGVNTVTGVWNLWEGRKDPNHKTLRMTHGILMLAADAGFVATGMLAPDEEEGYSGGSNNRSTHRTVALTSMGIATFSYLLMLFGSH